MKWVQELPYPHKPMIGISSQTDPSNYTTFYTYDNLGRLRFIKDKNQKILKEYQYNFKLDELTAITTSPSTAVFVGQTISLTTTTTGGSGTFLYKWTLTNAHINQVLTTSTPSLQINTTTNHAPNFTVHCEITDTLTQEKVTTTIQLNVTTTMPPLQVGTITYTATNYNVGTNVHYSLPVSGGSGNFQYSWSKINSQRTYSYPTNSNNLSNTILGSDCNSFTMQCTLKDLVTHTKITKSVRIYVNGGCSGGGKPRGGNQ